MPEPLRILAGDCTVTDEGWAVLAESVEPG